MVIVAEKTDGNHGRERHRKDEDRDFGADVNAFHHRRSARKIML
jgi:hypothetical protein